MEIWIVGAVVLFFFFLSHFGGMPLLRIGVILITVGLFVGVPIGFRYHLLLFRRRKMFGEGMRRWWLSPQRYHGSLPEKDRKLLDRWFLAGALFFSVAMLGCGLVFVGLMISR